MRPLVHRGGREIIARDGGGFAHSPRAPPTEVGRHLPALVTLNELTESTRSVTPRRTDDFRRRPGRGAACWELTQWDLSAFFGDVRRDGPADSRFLIGKQGAVHAPWKAAFLPGADRAPPHPR